MGRRTADKLCKLSVSCAKSEILLRTRTPIDLFEAANPGCPDVLKPQAVVSLGGQYLVGPGETVFSVVEDLQLQPFDITPNLSDDSSGANFRAYGGSPACSHPRPSMLAGCKILHLFPGSAQTRINQPGLEECAFNCSTNSRYHQRPF